MTENIKITESLEQSQFKQALFKRCLYLLNLGLPLSLLQDKRPINIPSNTNLTKWTVKDSYDSIVNNINNWKNRFTVNGILINSGLINDEYSSLNGKYFIAIDIDEEHAYNELLEGTTLEEIKKKYWVEDHETPHYKLHIFVVTDKPLPYLKETIKLSKGENLGIGVFSNNNQWIAMSPSINSTTRKYWRLSKGSRERLEPLSDHEYEELYNRIKRVCEINGITYGEDSKKANKVKSPTIFNGHSTQKPIIYGEANDHNHSNREANSEVNTDFLIDNSVRLLKPHYHEPNRNDIAYYFAGGCVWYDHDISIPLTVLQRLGKETNDEELQKRIDTIERTYKEASLEGKKKVKGLSGLENILGGKNNPNYQYLKKLLSVKLAGEEEKDEEKLSNLDIIRELTSDITPFKDQLGIPYVNLDHINISLDSPKIDLYIRHICKNSEYDFTPSSEDINIIINEFKSRAEFENEEEIKLDVRVANDPNDEFNWYYDLCDKKGTSININSEGWDVETNTPILFKRFKNMKPQVLPIRDKDSKKYWDEFIDLFNIKNEEDRLLYEVKVISLFIPNIDRVITMTHGKQGGGKSMSQELEKKFIDPCLPLTYQIPETKNELIQILHHNHSSLFDNISFVSDSYADILCRTSTGGGFMKRALYENDEDYPYDFRRCIGINGINLTTNRPDIRDRTIIIEQERIAELSRKDKEEIWKKFDKLASYALAYVFDILSQVNKLKKEGVDYVKKPNRMLHFHKYGELISVCLGNEICKFTNIYNENIASQSTEVIENDFVCQVLKFWVDNFEPINDITSNVFYKRMKEIATEYLGMSKYGDKRFPTSAKGLTDHLKRYEVDLLKQGIQITRKHTKEGNKISVKKVDDKSNNKIESLHSSDDR